MRKAMLCSLLLTVALGLSGATNAWASEKAKALFVQGSAMHQVPGNESHALASGDTLPGYTQITTGPNSSVDLAIGETAGSALKIDPNSRVGLTTSDTVNIRVEQGKVVLIVKDMPTAGSVHIETPFAASSVTSQGGFAVSADAVEVFEGAPLEMRTSAGETLVVEPGSGLRMATDGSASEPYQVQNTSSYSDFKGQISDYRWAIPGTSEYAGVPETSGPAKDVAAAADAASPEAKPNSAPPVDKAAEAANEAVATPVVTVNLPPVPDQEAVI